MAGEEKKRNPAMETSTSQPPAKKKRVEHSQLPSPFDAVNPQIGDADSNSKKTRSEKKEQEMDLEKSKGIDASRVGVIIDDSNHEEPKVEHPQMTPRYASKLYQYLRSMEVEPKRRPLPNYMETIQIDVTPMMRGALIDWMVDVAQVHGLLSDTLFLAVSYVNRFLSYNAMNLRTLELLGISSMLIASKLEESTPPHVEFFCLMSDNTYTKEEVVAMESDMLKLLQFEMGSPTILTFLRRFILAGQEDHEEYNLILKYLAYYLAELSLIDYDCLRFLPSVIAASAVYLAKFTIDFANNPWSEKMETSTGYKLNELIECILALRELQLNRKCSSWRAVRDKYMHDQFISISTLRPEGDILLYWRRSIFEELEEEQQNLIFEKLYSRLIV